MSRVAAAFLITNWSLIHTICQLIAALFFQPPLEQIFTLLGDLFIPSIALTVSLFKLPLLLDTELFNAAIPAFYYPWDKASTHTFLLVNRCLLGAQILLVAGIIIFVAIYLIVEARLPEIVEHVIKLFRIVFEFLGDHIPWWGNLVFLLIIFYGWICILIINSWNIDWLIVPMSLIIFPTLLFYPLIISLFNSMNAHIDHVPKPSESCFLCFVRLRRFRSLIRHPAFWQLSPWEQAV